jgi:hypothetical protein
MKQTIKFPSGYDVVVVDKNDVLRTLNASVTDKEVLLEIISQIEIQSDKLCREGRWTGIPYLGNLRVPAITKHRKDMAELYRTAYKTLPKSEYLAFVRKSTADKSERIKNERLFKYQVSLSIKRNPKLYKELCKDKGTKYANFYFYSRYSIIPQPIYSNYDANDDDIYETIVDV